jgi:hypothetical protein
VVPGKAEEGGSHSRGPATIEGHKMDIFTANVPTFHAYRR